jgi:hypothetical protein
MLLDNKVEIVLVPMRLCPDIADTARNFLANRQPSKNFLSAGIYKIATAYRSNNKAVCRGK